MSTRRVPSETQPAVISCWVSLLLQQDLFLSQSIITYIWKSVHFSSLLLLLKNPRRLHWFSAFLNLPCLTISLLTLQSLRFLFFIFSITSLQGRMLYFSSTAETMEAEAATTCFKPSAESLLSL